MATRSTAETAKYIRSQTKELARLSRESGLDVLGYLLDVAVLEAEAQINVRGAVVHATVPHTPTALSTHYSPAKPISTIA